MLKNKVYHKLFLTISIILLGVLISHPLLKATTFPDVKIQHDNYAAIEYLKREHIINGYNDGQFHPELTINRAEFTKIIVGAIANLKDINLAINDNCFKDISSNQWYSGYICYAKKHNIVEGYLNGNFNPADPINFAEAAKIITKAFGYKLDENGETWFSSYVNKLANLKSIPLTITAFNHKINRGEMTEIIFRLRTKIRNKASQNYQELNSKSLVATDSGLLPQFGSCKALRTQAEKFAKNETKYFLNDLRPEKVIETSAPETTPNQGSSRNIVSQEYSQTNLQVNGVDEADIIKNDGKYIYLIKRDEIRIIEAYPADNMQEVSRISTNDPNFRPQELFLNGDQLIIIGQTHENPVYNKIPRIREIMPIPDPYWGENKTAVYTFDISDRAKPTETRRVKFDGDYSSSRRVNDTLYLVLNKYPNLYYPLTNTAENILVPKLRDSANENTEEKLCNCEDIRFFPDSKHFNFLMVVAIPLANPKGKIESEVIVGGSSNIYSSPKNLYIVQTDYNYDNTKNHENTNIYKWSLNHTDIELVAKGSVPGRVLNQFSMDEYDKHFRIATSQGDFMNEDNLASNNLYILDSTLKQVGYIENIALGERIFSVRFMGKKAYMVTYRNTDPLFVIDLSKHDQPKILGQLKIPGFSDYLHPYDENHLIGFGKNAIENKEDPSFAWYQGMKIALFDVTDANNPKQLYQEIIGDRGTTSELLHNHKALLFDKSKNLLAFPITVYEIKDKENASLNTYGSPVFQGAYVYNISLKDGFKLRGKINHQPKDIYNKSGDRFYNYNTSIQRIIYIGANLYSISQKFIQAANMETTKKLSELELEPAKDPYYDEVKTSPFLN